MIRIVIIDRGEYLELSEFPGLEYESNLFRFDDFELNRSVGLEIPLTPHNTEVLAGAGMSGSDGTAIRSGMAAELAGEGVSISGTLYIDGFTPDSGWSGTLVYGENEPLRVLSEDEGTVATELSITWKSGEISTRIFMTPDGPVSIGELAVLPYYITEDEAGESSVTSIDATLYDVTYSSYHGYWIAVGEGVVVKSEDAEKWEVAAEVTWTGYSIALLGRYVYVATNEGLKMSTNLANWSTRFNGGGTRASVAAGTVGVCYADNGGNICICSASLVQVLSYPMLNSAGVAVSVKNGGRFTDVVSNGSSAWGVIGSNIIVYVSTVISSSSISWYTYTQYPSVTTDVLWGTETLGTHSGGAVTSAGKVYRPASFEAEDLVTVSTGAVMPSMIYGLVYNRTISSLSGQIYGYDGAMMVGEGGAAYYNDTAVTSPADNDFYGVKKYGGRYVVVGTEGALYYSDNNGQTWTEGLVYTQTGPKSEILPMPSVGLLYYTYDICGHLGYTLSLTTAQAEALRDYWITLPSANDQYGNQCSEGDTVYLEYNIPDLGGWEALKTCAALLGCALHVDGTKITLHDYSWSQAGCEMADPPAESEVQEVWYGVGEDGAQSNPVTIERDDEDETPVVEYLTSNDSLSDENELYEIPLNGGASYGGVLVCNNIEVDEDDEGNVTYTYEGDSYLGYLEWDNVSTGSLKYVAAMAVNNNLQAIYTYSRSVRVRMWMQPWEFAAIDENTLIPWRGGIYAVESGDYEDGEAELVLVALPSDCIS